MYQVPDGYQLAVLSREGKVLDAFDIGGRNLAHPVEAAQLAGAVISAVHRAQVSRDE